MPLNIVTTPPESLLDLVYQDDYLVAINKPSGLLVHRSMIDRHETRFALQLTRDLIGKKVYPVHRLDKPTSGILLFALDSQTARLLNAQFTSHQQIEKTYLALTRGFVEQSGIINHALKEKLDKIADVLADKDKAPQQAVTSYRCLQHYEIPSDFEAHESSRYSLVELKAETGRKHQLRRHMKHISHHIIGDTTYGDGRHNRFFRQTFNCHRLLLHANSLSFLHPVSEKHVTLTANLPSELAILINSLKPFKQSLIDQTD